jgi:hypothetical protein
MATRYHYEWTVEFTARRETTEHEKGEIVKSDWSMTLADLLEEGNPDPENLKMEIALVCDDEQAGERSWAYIQFDGFLDSHLRDSSQYTVRKVPARFVEEWRKNLPAINKLAAAQSI